MLQLCGSVLRKVNGRRFYTVIGWDRSPAVRSKVLEVSLIEIFILCLHFCRSEKLVNYIESVCVIDQFRPKSPLEILGMINILEENLSFFSFLSNLWEDLPYTLVW